MVITPNMVIYNGFWPIPICYIIYILHSHNWYIWWPTPNILFGMIFLVILFTNQQWLGAFLLTIGPDEDPIQNMEQLWLRIHNQKTWDVASKPICTDDFLMKFWMMIWIRKWETYTPSYSGCSGILWQAQHAHHHLRRMVWKHILFLSHPWISRKRICMISTWTCFLLVFA